MKHVSVPAVLSALLGVALLILLSTAFSIAVPEARDFVFGEDRIVEWLTVIAFAAALVLGVCKLRGRARSDLLLIAVVAVAGLAVLDELSFGERMFGWTPPHVLGTKLDAGHDFFRIGQKLIKRYSDTPYLVAGIGALILCVPVAAFIGWLRRRGWNLFFGPESVLLGAAILCLAVAQGIDIHLRILRSDIIGPLYVEEVLELSAGVLFLCFVQLRPTVRPDAGAVSV